MNSEAQLAALDRALGDRELIWFGIRGDDAAAMLRLPQFTSCFSVTAPLRAAKLAVSESLEDITGLRVDLDTYDIDIDPGAEVLLLRRRLLARANRRSAIATYRPSHFLSAAHFASLDTAQYLGLFKDRQTAFEHKPWVETQLRRIGVRTLDWRYFADESRHEVRRSLERGPLVLRASRSSGGEGIELLESPDALDEKWPFRNDHLVAVSRYLADSVPVNIGACVFPGGTVVLHPASVQLIGIPECTNRRFGYCGNDFGAFAELDPSIVQDVDRTTRLVGAWLASVGYLGAFGVDPDHGSSNGNGHNGNGHSNGNGNGNGHALLKTNGDTETAEMGRDDLLPYFMKGLNTGLSRHEMSAGSIETLLARPSPLWKRALDVTGAGIGVLLAAPLMLFAYLGIKLTSPGPAIFKQQRAGLGGRPFTIYKFRTMCTDAEAKKKELRKISEQDGPAFKLTHDPRVFRFGSFLRKTSIDELPQLFNIIKGDMSLVGPRPLPVDEANNCAGWQRRRLDVTPGLTCIWQIFGRSKVTFSEWVRMDVAYIRRRTIFHDLKLIFMTVPAVLMRRGAK